MRLTTKGRFAVTAMLDLALHEKADPVTIADISDRQHISPHYLEQLFNRMRKHGLVKSVRGPGGGYRIARPQEHISIAQIIDAVEEPLDATLCGGKENCHQGHRCLTHGLWVGLNEKLVDHLSSISLEALVLAESGRSSTVENVMVMQPGVR